MASISLSMASFSPSLPLIYSASIRPNRPMMASFSPSLPLIYFASIRPNRPMIAASATASSGDGKARAWWAPLFRSIIADPGGEPKGVEAGSGSGSEGKTGRSRLTAEKAKELRRQLRESESWHDAMYHSVIASRLASPDHR